MANTTINNIKLGSFVLAGLLFLVVLLFLLGKNRSIFSNTYILKTRFENTQGLVAGHNVRFAGIQAGTVKKVQILADTVIEVTMSIDSKMQTIIRKNAVVSIGTDGLVGNKVVNILPVHEPAPFAVAGDVLKAKKAIATEEMLETLSQTNNDVAVIAAELKTAVQRLNSSHALWALLNDNTIPLELRRSVTNIQLATGKAGKMVNNLDAMVKDIRDGKGSVGTLLTDTSFAYNLNEAVAKINSVGMQADALALEIGKLVSGIQQDVNSGAGPVNALLKDSTMVLQIHTSLDNIQKGTEGFNQNMEALKQNFLFRGYFRKLEKQKQKQKD